MIILGVDPGYARTGWCVLEISNNCPQIVEYGCIETTATDKSFFRILKMADSLEEIMSKYKPEVLAIEELFFLKKSKTLFQIAQFRGTIIYLAAKNGLRIYEYNPKNVKNSLTGYGGADKYQIQNMIKNIVGLKAAPKPDDAADAIAIALCHYFNVERFKNNVG